MGYLHRCPAKLEDDNEHWVIQHLLVCTHAAEKDSDDKLIIHLLNTHSCTVGMNMKGNVANTHRDPNRCRLFRFPYLLQIVQINSRPRNVTNKSQQADSLAYFLT